MDDHFLTACEGNMPVERDEVLDPVTQELKTEFARLERERKQSLERNRVATYHVINSAIETALASSEQGHLTRSLTNALDKIGRILDALAYADGVFGGSPFLQKQFRVWSGAYRSTQQALIKLLALLACSLQASLRTPLFFDGAELNTFKHRFR